MCALLEGKIIKFLLKCLVFFCMPKNERERERELWEVQHQFRSVIIDSLDFQLADGYQALQIG